MIYEKLNTENVIINLAGSSKNDLLTKMIAPLVSAGVLSNSNQALELFLERESKGSTGIGNGIAIPHIRTDQVSEIHYVMATSQDGVDFDSLDAMPVHILFLMVAPSASAGIHIKALARISRMLNDEALRQRLRCSQDPSTVIELLRQREEELG